MNENGKDIIPYARAARAFLPQSRWYVPWKKKYCTLVAFWVPKFCVVSSCLLSFQFQCSPTSSSANSFFGPRGQVSSRGQPNEGTNESLPCIHVCSGFCIVYPYQCRLGSMRYVPNRDQQRHGFLVFPFSSVVARRPARHGQCCQNKAS